MLNFNEFLDNEDIITEGIHDKFIFKAFYLAGGPGSGKSWVAAKTLEGSGLKVVNSDDGFERYANKAGLDLKQMGDFTKDQTKLKDALRQRAKRGTQSMGQHAVDGRLGLIIDSTARDADKIESASQGLRYLGYQTYMIFVNTTVEVALRRNEERPRSVPEMIVRRSHSQIQKQIPRLIRMFGANNFIEVQNNENRDDINTDVYKAIRRKLNNKIESPIAKRWIENEKALIRARNPSGKINQGFFARIFR